MVTPYSTDNVSDDEDESNLNPFHNVNSKYITEKNLNNLFNFNETEAINILHVNARSLKKNFSHLETLLSNIQNPIMAIAISETWLTESTESTFFIPNYTLVSSSRVGKSGGGVGIFVNNSLSFTIRSDLSCMMNIIECLFIEVTIRGKKNIIIGTVYRPPGGDQIDISNFNTEFCKILKNINNEKRKTVIIAGDFNLDLQKYDSHKPTAEFLDNLLSYSYCPTINYPTRISATSRTLIDNIFVNCTPDQFNSAIVCNDISDHLPVAVHLKSSVAINVQRKSNGLYRDFNQRALSDFDAALQRPNLWNEVIRLANTSNDPNLAYNCFITTYYSLFNEFFPEKKKKFEKEI